MKNISFEITEHDIRDYLSIYKKEIDTGIFSNLWRRTSKTNSKND